MAKENQPLFKFRTTCTAPLRSATVTKAKLNKILKWLNIEADGKIKDITKVINDYADWPVFGKDMLTFTNRGTRWYKAYQDAVLMPKKYIKPDIKRFGRLRK